MTDRSMKVIVQKYFMLKRKEETLFTCLVSYPCFEGIFRVVVFIFQRKILVYLVGKPCKIWKDALLFRIPRSYFTPSTSRKCAGYVEKRKNWFIKRPRTMFDANLVFSTNASIPVQNIIHCVILDNSEALGISKVQLQHWFLYHVIQPGEKPKKREFLINSSITTPLLFW